MVRDLESVLAEGINRRTGGHMGVESWMPAAREIAAVIEAEVIRPREREALEDAADYFQHQMAVTRGGGSSWLTTGDRVADLVAYVLRERAEGVAG